MARFWKLKRELTRVNAQVRELGDKMKAQHLRRSYDKRRQSDVSRWPGEQPASDTMAVLIVFQPEGLSASLFFTLSHLRAKGISVVVVANHALDDAALLRLIPDCHMVISRPNVGYDFGGYREGIISLFESGAKPNHLFVLNDSMWFPVRENCQLIDEALSAPEDLYGIFLNTKSKKAAHAHLQSYFYRFGPKLLGSTKFLSYWRTLPIFSNKRTVVRQYEVKLTGHFAARGFSVAAWATGEDVLKAALGLSPEEKLRLARFYASTTRRGQQIFGDIANMDSSSEGFVEAVNACFQAKRFRYYFIDAHPLVFLKQMNGPFLKKSREYHFWRQRKEVLALGLDASMPSHRRDELKACDAGRDILPPEDRVYPELEKRWFS